MQQAIFGAGCFWGVEATFQGVQGVLSATVGYSGGTLHNPSYEDVCTGESGHAEVVQITYDPTQITYEGLLTIFWQSHNPTTRNRQGPDVGSQYRSVIFYHTPEQQVLAQASKESQQQSGKYASAIVTDISPAGPFYPAEEYHQRYLEKRGLRHCRVGE